MTIHHLKSWPEFYEPVVRREKLFEIRINDRNYQKGDELHLREWDPKKQKYTGRACSATVIYVAYGKNTLKIFPENVCVMAIKVSSAIP